MPKKRIFSRNLTSRVKNGLVVLFGVKKGRGRELSKGRFSVHGNRLYRRNLRMKKYTFIEVARNEFVMLTVLGVLILMQSIILLYSSFFQIKDVEVRGLVSDYDSSVVKQLVSDELHKDSLIIPRNNIFTIPVRQVRAAVLDNYHVKGLTVEKDILERIVYVDISELDPVLSVAHDRQFWYVGAEGKIIKEVPIEHLDTSLPVVTVEGMDNFSIGSMVIDPSVAEMIPYTIAFIESESDMRIIAFYIGRIFGSSQDEVPQYELNMLTERGIRIRMGTQVFRDVEKYKQQLGGLYNVTHKYAHSKLSEIAEIDMRFLDRAYITYKDGREQK